jgi:hypothetical protein
MRRFDFGGTDLAAVCLKDPQEKGQPDARIFKLAVALG